MHNLIASTVANNNQLGGADMVIELIVLVGAKGDDENTDNICLPFSLTKYSAIFAEVNGYFGIEFYVGYTCSLRMQDRNANNNQPATVGLCC